MNNAATEFATSMQKLGLDAPQPRIAVAVSGGGDSLALTLLMKDWVDARGGELLALTVDHGLRAESRAEAEGLHARLAARGIAHRILVWDGEKPVTHIQERAREARYRLLLDACRAEKFPVLAVAHNLEDQIETFWMRLAKGSGLDGLASMAASRDFDGVRMVRPLMSFTRAQLRDVCAGFGVDWMEDPSNDNEKFLRVKLRQFEELLLSEGLTPQRLSNTLQKLEEAREALQLVTQAALKDVARFHEAGFAVLHRDGLASLHPEIQRRVVAAVVQAVAPRDYLPGFEALEQARLEILDRNFAGRTLAGCEFYPGPGAEVLISREASAAPQREALVEGMLWDGRFWVSGYRVGTPDATWAHIGILGENGLSDLRKNIPPETDSWRRLESLPFKVKKVLPALWHGENVVAVPYLNWQHPEEGKGLEQVHIDFVQQVRRSRLPV